MAQTSRSSPSSHARSSEREPCRSRRRLYAASMRRIKAYLDALPDHRYAAVAGISTFALCIALYSVLGMSLDSALIIGGGVALGSALGAPRRRGRYGRWRKRFASRFARPS